MRTRVVVEPLIYAYCCNKTISVYKIKVYGEFLVPVSYSRKKFNTTLVKPIRYDDDNGPGDSVVNYRIEHKYRK